MNTIRSLALATSLLATAAAAQAPAAQPDVDLKLFDKVEVDLSKGCSVALWQADRDPQKDRFAYLMTEVLTGQNHARQPARIKVAGEVVPLTRVAVGGKTPGYGLYPYQLYKLPGANEFAILDLKLAEEQGEAVEIESGSVTIVMRGRQVFRASVKGGAGCVTPPAADTARPQARAPQPAPAAPAEPGPGQFERYTVRPEQVPRALTQAMAKQFGCEAATMRRPVTGYQMSEESAIWQVACGEYAGKFSAVFALVYLTDPAKQYSFIPLKWPKGQTRGLGDNAMMAPQWDLKARVVTSIYTEGNGKDCGSLERHRVTAEGGFQLIELRARDQCDGKAIGAENFPVVFKAR
jgi:hypothetical protein